MNEVHTEYRVTGMTCQHCVDAVTSELEGLDGVRGVEVELKSGKVTVSSAAPPNREAVREAVDEAGYELAES